MFSFIEKIPQSAVVDEASSPPVQRFVSSRLLRVQCIIAVKCLLLQFATLAIATDPAAGVGNNSAQLTAQDQFANATPVLTFIDNNTGLPWGRYVVSETVTVPKYKYVEQKERIWQPKWVTEPRTTTVTQYDPIYSYQWQLKNAPSWNPFAAPAQQWEYAPIVQYQPRYTQVTQPTTYQKYEEVLVTKMVPELVNESEQRAKYVDRPLNSGGSLMANNIYQQNAMIAAANRNSSPLPIRPMDIARNGTFGSYGPYGFQPRYGQPLVAAAPAPYYVAPNANGAANAFVANPAVLPPTNPNSAAINPSTAMVAANGSVYSNPYASGYSGYGYPGAAYGNPPYPQYAAMPPRPTITWPTIASSTGSLFPGGLFRSNSNYNSNYYVASNPNAMPASQPYIWNPNQPTGVTFRPNTPTYTTPNNGAWTSVPSAPYRDPIQGGMPATVMR